MIPKEELSLIGFIKRPHGIQGNIQLQLEEEIALTQGDFLFLKLNGQYIPYPVENSSNSKGQLIVQLGFIHEVQDIKRLVGTEVYKQFRRDEAPATTLVAYHLIDDVLGDLGEILHILQYPHQQMIQINYSGKECLIPMTEGIIHSVSEEHKEVYCSLPEGLLDL